MLSEIGGMDPKTHRATQMIVKGKGLPEKQPELCLSQTQRRAISYVCRDRAGTRFDLA
jgi:hypothetical protein